MRTIKKRACKRRRQFSSVKKLTLPGLSTAKIDLTDGIGAHIAKRNSRREREGEKGVGGFGRRSAPVSSAQARTNGHDNNNNKKEQVIRKKKFTFAAFLYPARSEKCRVQCHLFPLRDGHPPLPFPPCCRDGGLPYPVRRAVTNLACFVLSFGGALLVGLCHRFILLWVRDGGRTKAERESNCSYTVPSFLCFVFLKG